MASSFTRHRLSARSKKRSNSIRKKVVAGSDIDVQDGEEVVPWYNTFLDNSKTLSNSCAASETSTNALPPCATLQIEWERKAWMDFKFEILKLTHSLQIEGWKKLSFKYAGDIKVERLSGALTNDVYVISPPLNLPISTSNSKGILSKPCSRIILRIYGPQVDHLIDREHELNILRRLSRKNIGPRMLGTFKNGRFEEFLNAKTLTSEDLRKPDTSQQIAKRMRELHDGVELLEREREEGPFVWKNWDKWVDRCEKIMGFLDNEVKNRTSSSRLLGIRRHEGFYCGVEWPQFKSAVEKYRKWLDDYYGQDRIKQSLVFAHNDTQYGNILRLIPETIEGSSPSPLLLPENTHKQLIVIDFEYASANTPGLEFANHFTEWCYNYHNPTHPWLCDTSRYPTQEEQTRFIRSYVNHQTHLKPHTVGVAEINSASGPKTNNDFSLDNRNSNSIELDYSATSTEFLQHQACGELETEQRVEELLNDARLWRAANSAQWVVWGIVQAHVPDFNSAAKVSFLMDTVNTYESKNIPSTQEPKESHEEIEITENRDEFDYLSYASDRALIFWGDLIGLGIISKKELPCDLVERIKLLDF